MNEAAPLTDAATPARCFRQLEHAVASGGEQRGVSRTAPAGGASPSPQPSAGLILAAFGASFGTVLFGCFLFGTLH